jgi:pyroglutamyl-peptidase
VLQTLLTGFGPFLSVVNNPSERLAAYFDANPVAGHALTTRIVPVSFRDATATVQEAIAAGGVAGKPFDIILMLGVAAKRPHWSVECLGRNRSTTSVADSANCLWPYPCIVGDAPETLPATLPADALVAAIEKVGLPVIASVDAGDYLCNHLLFWTLSHLDATDHPARAGFLHVPADTETLAPGVVPQVTFTFEQHCAAVRAALQALAAPAGDPLDL